MSFVQLPEVSNSASEKKPSENANTAVEVSEKNKVIMSSATPVVDHQSLTDEKHHEESSSSSSNSSSSPSASPSVSPSLDLSYPASSNIHELSSQQLSAIQLLHAAHNTPPLIINHRNWHTCNSIGGVMTPRDFEKFVDPRWTLPLSDFRTLEDVGRAYSLQNHVERRIGRPHFAIGPMLDSVISPADPSFYRF